MKRKWLALMTAICLLGSFFTSCAGGGNGAQAVADVIRGDLIISVDASGNLEMPHKANLSFGTTGVVKEITVDDGEKVSEGQVLARLDAPSLEANVRMRQAEYEMAELSLMQTIFPHYSYRYSSDQPGVWLALEEAKDNLEQAETHLSKGEIDEAQAALDVVEENLDEAERKSQARVWALPLSVKLAELQVDQAETALDMAKADLGKATITALFDGVVADITINEGQQLSTMTYADPAIVLIDPTEIEMKGVIDEIDVSKVKLGQEANIILDALPEKELEGNVTFISSAGTVEAGVVFYKTTITLADPDSDLRDGMSATAEIVVDRRDNVLLIPNRAIRGSRENPWVEVVTDSETEQREVSLGVSNGISTEVLSGLEEGEKVVLPEISQVPFTSFG
jgi:RND family efflux transporter MFP subunit